MCPLRQLVPLVLSVKESITGFKVDHWSDRTYPQSVFQRLLAICRSWLFLFPHSPDSSFPHKTHLHSPGKRQVIYFIRGIMSPLGTVRAANHHIPVCSSRLKHCAAHASHTDTVQTNIRTQNGASRAMSRRFSPSRPPSATPALKPCRRRHARNRPQPELSLNRPDSPNGPMEC